MANLKDTIIAGALRVTGTIFGNLRGTIDGFTVAKSVPSDAVFTDTVTTVTTSGSGNAVTALSASNGAITATKGSTFLTSHQTIKQDGVTGATANRYASCTTAAATAAKTASITTGTFSLEAGAMVAVNITNRNSADNPTLNINSTGAKNIFVGGTKITSGANKGVLAGLCFFVYDGTQYHLVNADSVYILYNHNSANYPVTFAASGTDGSTATEYLRKCDEITINPDLGNLTTVQLNGVNVGSAPKFTDTTYTATTTKLVTTTVPNVTNKGTVPSLTITSTDCDDITAWTTNTPSTVPTMSASEGVVTFTAGANGTAASLSYTARSVGSASGWSAGTTPTLGTAITVATGSTASNGGGATVATGITAS